MDFRRWCSGSSGSFASSTSSIDNQLTLRRCLCASGVVDELAASGSTTTSQLATASNAAMIWLHQMCIRSAPVVRPSSRAKKSPLNAGPLVASTNILNALLLSRHPI